MEGGQRSLDRIGSDSIQRSQRQAGQSVRNIVESYYIQVIVFFFLAIYIQVETSVALVVKRNIFGGKVSILFVHRVSNDFAGKSFCDLLVIINIPVDDQGAMAGISSANLQERVAVSPDL